MSFRGALKAMRAYSPKELGSGRFFNKATGSCCAIGAICPKTRKVDTNTITGIAYYHPEAMAELRQLGLDWESAGLLMCENDDIKGLHRDEPNHARYERVLKWLEDRVAAEEVHK